MEEATVMTSDEGEDAVPASDGSEIGGLVNWNFAADLRRGAGLLAMNKGDLVRSDLDLLADDGLELLEAEGRVDDDGANVDLLLPIEAHNGEGGAGGGSWQLHLTREVAAKSGTIPVRQGREGTSGSSRRDRILRRSRGGRRGMMSRQWRPAELGSVEGFAGEVEVGEARLRTAREKPNEAATAERDEGDDAGDGGGAEVEDDKGGREAGAEPVREGAGDEERSDGGDEDSEEDEGTEGLAIEEGATEDDEGAAPLVRKTTASTRGDLG